MLAEKSEVIDEAVGQIYKITRDEILRQKMEAREEYYRIERTNQRLMEEKDKALEEKDNEALIENDGEKRAILDLSKKVLNKLSGRSDMIKKEVEAIMGGKILDYEAKDILNQGISLGKAEGKAEEKAETLERVTKNYMEMDPTLTVEEAREKARMILK